MGLIGSAVAALVHADVPPLTPDSDDARKWAEQELSDPAYRIAEPTLFDRIMQAIGEFITSLFDFSPTGEWPSALALIAALIVVAVIVVAFIVWGRPRAIRRSRAATGDLFDGPERRSAAELRTAAEAHASRAEWEAAVVLRFRAIARRLDERGAVDTLPGATVHVFARAATRAFPASAVELDGVAAVFDDVRYLRRPGTAELYRRVVDLDTALDAQHPVPSLTLQDAR